MTRHRRQTILGDIPPDWEARPLRSLLADEFSGDWGDDEGEVALSVLRSTNFTDSGNLKVDDVAKRGFTRSKAARVQVQINDILVERSGGGPSQPVGRVAMIREVMPDTGFANFVQALRPDATKVDPELLLWSLHQLNRSGLVEKLQHQTTQMRNLDLRDYLKVLVPVPSDAKEQTRIGETLKATDDHIRALEGQVRKAEQVKKALLLAAFPAYAKGVSPPAGFRNKSLRHLVASWANGLYVPDSEYGSGVPIIRIDTFEDGYFYSRDFKRVRIDETDRNRFAVLEGDVLLNRVNSHPFLGKVVFVDRLDEPTVFESNMMRLHFLSRVVAQWTALALSSSAYKRVIWALGRPAVGQLSVNQREVGQIHIVVPDTEAQMKDSIEQIGTARSYVEVLNHQLTAARRVKQSLLQNLLTGKIRLKP
jgi:type I restriction enzyme, S subunit